MTTVIYCIFTPEARRRTEVSEDRRIRLYYRLIDSPAKKKYYTIRNQKNISEKTSGRKGSENGCIHHGG